MMFQILQFLYGKFYDEVYSRLLGSGLVIGRDFLVSSGSLSKLDVRKRFFRKLPMREEVSFKYFVDDFNELFRNCLDNILNLYVSVNYLTVINEGVSGKPFAIEKVYIDFDVKEVNRLDKVKIIVKEFIQYLETYNIEPYIHFSGRKGYALIIWLPYPDYLIIKYRLFAKALFGIKFWNCVFIDKSVLEPNRVTRLPYTRHGDTNNLVTPLDTSLKPIDIEDFNPSNYFSRSVIPSSIIEVVNDWYVQDKIEESIRVRDLIENFKKETIKYFSDSKYLPIIIRSLINYGVNEGCRNNACFIIATYLKALNHDHDTVLNELLTWNLRNKPPLPDKEIKYIINSVFRHGYKPLKRETIVQKLQQCVEIL